MRGAVVLLLLLAGCAAQHAHQAASSLIGMRLVDVEALLGLPDKQQGDIAEWNYVEPSTGAAVPFAALALLPVTLPLTLVTSGSLTLNTTHNCRMVAALEHGRIQRMVFTGDNGGISGTGAACEPILRGAEITD